MTGPRGPTINLTTPAYVKHPPAASGWLPDGAPLGSGTAHILHNNLSVLGWQNTRELGHIVGPGNVAASNTIGLWTSETWVESPSGSDVWASIPWVQARTACVFGPFVPAFTRVGTSPPGLYPRGVRVVVECAKSATAASTLTLMAALVDRPETPLNAPVIGRDYTTLVAADVGANIVVLDVSPDHPLAPSDSWRSRPTGTAIVGSTRLVPLYLWVGWASNDSGFNGDAIISVSAFEVME